MPSSRKLACVAGGILSLGVLFWQWSCHTRKGSQEVFSRAAKPSGKILPATFLMSFECCPLLSPCLEPFWLLSHEEFCNRKLTCKRARPSITVKSRTKQLFIESYSGSRQGMMQLLQTWGTKFSINGHFFSGNKKQYTSNEVKEFPKMHQRSNSVRDKDNRKSMLECIGNTSASWPLNRQRSFAQSKTRILHSILHPYF